MLRIRTFDRKAINLQRQGRLGTYAPFEGQEAAQVGSALALIPTIGFFRHIVIMVQHYVW